MKQSISEINSKVQSPHMSSFAYLADILEQKGVNVGDVITRLSAFQCAIPSWALGSGGTRFGRFSIGGEPGSLEDKINDIGVIHSLTGCAGAISLHIPWDIPEDVMAIKQLAKANHLVFDAVNSNTFQDQKSQIHSYKYGSLSSIHKDSRDLAIEHNIEVVKIGEQLGSKSITVWLADGSNFPGQVNFRKALHHTSDSLKSIYASMPSDWSMFIEYKPYEPNFYHTVIQDWGTSFMLANECGDRAFTLVDLGHHLPNTNIEYIVSILMSKGKLGGFHFNDSKYGDDDLTVGSIKPYQLFLIFNELVYGMNNNLNNPLPAWMIDASHNIKDPLEDLIQSLEAIMLAYAQALILDQSKLEAARENSDVVFVQELLQDAFRTDLRPLIAEVRNRKDAALNPITTYRQLKIREQLMSQRGTNTIATGL
jgi:L-rhamnose isomerase/sugar isomerase